MANENIIKHEPPHSSDIEKSLLGNLLYDPSKIKTISGILSPDDFYDLRYQIIYKNILDVYSKKLTIDISLLLDELKKENQPEIASNDFLRSIFQEATTSVFAETYANVIKEKSIMRRLISDCDKIKERVYSQQSELNDILEYAEKLIFSIVQNRKSTDFQTISDVILKVISTIEENAQKDGVLTGVTTGFTDLNNRTGGLQNSDLILVAARPAMGKTAFCLNLAKAAASSGVTTAIFSLEMSSEQLGNRLLAMESGLSATKLRLGDLEIDEWDIVINSSENLLKTKLLIDDTGSINIAELRSKCRKAKLEKNLGLIIIDYLQLMSGRGRENRQQEISEISRSLKLLAKELNVPVVALSQLSRAVEARADHHPMLSDLRESGAIEQDADVVMFLYRDDYYNEDSEEKGVAEVIIAKQRHGSTGTVKLRWIAEQTRFTDLEHSNEY